MTVFIKNKIYNYKLFLFISILLLSCDESESLIPLPGERSDFNVTIETLYALPAELNESSGLIYYDNLLWTINDSGNESVIYAFDPANGNIVKRVQVINSDNTDWEDIAQDESFIYVGDFGNNYGNRDDLKILIIEKNDITDEEMVDVEAQSINFSYADQTDFDPMHNSNSFDCEALITSGDSLYLFSKDWINETTTVYSLPKTPGTYVANVISSFNIGGLVTGADISDENILVLCGYTNYYYTPFISVFSGVEENNFFSAGSGKASFKLLGVQMEGIAFISDTTVYISSEASKLEVQSVFKVDFSIP